MPIEQVFKCRLNLSVFRLPDGLVTENQHQTFRQFLKDISIIICPRTGQNRTLYSLRHTYAKFALINDGIDIHTLAIQMGTSIGMIERHCSHLTPRLKKDLRRTCSQARRYDVPKGNILMTKRALTSKKGLYAICTLGSG